MNTTSLPLLKHTETGHFLLIAGPCVIENRELCCRVASEISLLSDKYGIPYVFKASYRKANRSRMDSFTGIGDEEGLAILQEIKETYHIPVLTDIHECAEAALAASYKIDILQIPAFLCRQTALLVAAAQTGLTVNIKKGQFLAPQQMQFAVDKVKDAGGSQVWITERGSQFGYTDLVVDFRGIPQMQATGCPVILDATHSLQQPNQSTGITGGLPHLIRTLATAGIAVGVDGLFLETHPNPAQALSDGANMLPLHQMESLIRHLLVFSDAARNAAEKNQTPANRQA